jgi:hypothetical protein
MDCGDTCLDVDGDGYGRAGAAGNTCTAADCDDAVAACTTDCTTDVDNDTRSDCSDACLDRDGDGYGTDGPAGTCLGADCDELRVACNSDCVACLPAALGLSSDSPRPACTDATLTLDLDGYDNAANVLSCTAEEVVVLPVEDFTNGFGRWSTRSNTNEVAIHTFPDGFPASCNTQQFAWIDDRGPDYFQLGTPLDTTNLENLTLSARVGFNVNTDPGDNLSLQACCGAGCTPSTFFVFLNGSSLGTDDCTDRNVPLPGYASDCSSLQIRFSFPNARSVVGVDDISITGSVIDFGAFTETATGTYQSTFRICEPTRVPVTCTWDDQINAPLTGTTDVLFE